MQLESLLPQIALHPLPIADALQALLAAESAHERRDRLVEAFRSVLRTLAALALASRSHCPVERDHLPGNLADLLRKLVRGSLTDGEWLGLTRACCLALKPQLGSHPVPSLLHLFLNKQSPFVGRTVDALLSMRRKDTVAHGTTGTRAAAEALVAQRLPYLCELLDALLPLWASARLAVLRERTESEDRLLEWQLWMGPTPHRGRFTRLAWVPDMGLRTLAPDSVVLLAPDGKVLLQLSPWVLPRAPAQGATDELFFFDGFERKAALYLAVPSMAVLRETELAPKLKALLEDTDAATPQELPPGVESPYRGLAAFQPEHAALFFGRETLASELRNRVLAHPWVSVTGASGSGKSSLLCAGLVPLLRAQSSRGQTPDELALQAWDCLVFRPGTQPVESLRSALRTLVPLGALADRPVETLATGLESHCQTEHRCLVLVLDQAEELLTLCADTAERLSFANLLARFAQHTNSSIRVVLSMREDFFARLASLEPWRAIATREVLVLTTPSRESLRRILVEPARKFGYRFEDLSLVDTMIDTVIQESAALALLQFTAHAMWLQRDRQFKLLTTASYEAIGGVQGALARHADTVLASLPAASARLARLILLRLVSAEGTRALASRTELQSLDGSEPRLAEHVLEALVSARLLTLREDGQLELIHEALLLHWDQLRLWRHEDQEGQSILQGLRSAAEAWQRRNKLPSLLWRDEALGALGHWQRRTQMPLTELEREFFTQSLRAETLRRRLRWGSVSTAFVLLLGFSAVLAQQNRLARQATQRERQARDRAETLALLAKAEGSYARHPASWALLRAAVRPEAAPELQAEIQRELLFARTTPTARVLQGPHARVVQLAWRDEGDVVAFFADGSARRWDLREGRTLAVVGPGEHDRGTWQLSPEHDFALRQSGRKLERWDLGPTAQRLLLDLPGEHDPVFFSGRDQGLFVHAGTLHTFDPAQGTLGATWTLPVPAPALSGFDLWRATVGKPWLFRSGTNAGFLSGRGPAEVLHTDTHQSVLLRRETAPVWASAALFSPDGTRLVTAHLGGAEYWNTLSGELLYTLPTNNTGIVQLAFSPTSQRWVTATGDGLGTVWGESPDGHYGPVGEVAMHRGPVTTLAYAPGGHLLASGGEDRSVHVWDVLNGDHYVELQGLDSPARALSFSSDNQRLAVGTDGGQVLVLEPALLPEFSIERPGFTVEPFSVELSPNLLRALWFPSFGAGATTTVEDLRTGRRLTELPKAPGPRPRFCGDDFLVSCSDQGCVSYDAQTARELARWTVEQPGRLYQHCVAPGEYLTLGQAHATVWDLRTGGELRRVDALLEHLDSRSSVRWTASGRELFVTPQDSELTHVLESATGRVLATVPELRRYESPLETQDPSGPVLIRAKEREVYVLLDRRTWTVLRRIEHVSALALDPTGQLLAVLSEGRVRVETLREGRLLQAFPHEPQGRSLAISLDGSLLVEASGEGHWLRVWELASGALLGRFELHRASSTLQPMFLPARRLLLQRGRWLTVHALSSLHTNAAQRSRELGQATNYRVCRDHYRVVSVEPFPAPGSLWAPEALCTLDTR